MCFRFWSPKPKSFLFQHCELMLSCWRFRGPVVWFPMGFPYERVCYLRAPDSNPTNRAPNQQLIIIWLLCTMGFITIFFTFFSPPMGNWGEYVFWGTFSKQQRRNFKLCSCEPAAVGWKNQWFNSWPNFYPNQQVAITPPKTNMTLENSHFQ